MKCKAVINFFDSQYECTISTKSAQIRFKPIDNKFDCDKQTEKGTKFIKYTAQTWSFWFFLNELNVSMFYRQCVIRHVNELKGTSLAVVVEVIEPYQEVIDRDW